jgi:hypothetical protein
MYQAVLFWSGFLMISELLMGGDVSVVVLIGAVGGCVAFAVRSDVRRVRQASAVLCLAGICVQSPLSVVVAVAMAGIYLKRSLNTVT